jgi:hypothetical protein
MNTDNDTAWASKTRFTPGLIHSVVNSATTRGDRARKRLAGSFFKREVLRDLAQAQRLGGVADGTRTHDNRNHNPGLYQLSYSHRKKSQTDAMARRKE